MNSLLSFFGMMNFLSSITVVTSFTPMNIHNTNQRTTPTTSTSTNLMIDDTILSSTISSSQNILATVSADIDSISNDEFGKVFAGGIAVMVGGVFSAVMVGFLLESSNSYANVVADSYAQGGDEDFWEKLNPEETLKAKELIAKLKASKEGREYTGIDEETANLGIKSDASGSDSGSSDAKTSTSNESGGNKGGDREAVSMFDDYDN
jgi:hypothetical protein